MAEGLFYIFVVLFLVRCGLIHSMWQLLLCVCVCGEEGEGSSLCWMFASTCK